MDKELEFKLIKPQQSLNDFVESFWLLRNMSDKAKEIVVLPDGRVELTLSKSAIEDFHITLSGIETHPQQATIAPNSITFAISFKLLAIEYILHKNISNVLNYAKRMAVDFLDFAETDLNDFELFCKKATQKIEALIPKSIDERKLKLFELIYSSKGELSVKELSEKAFWTSRQINRYFNQQFGVSLKTYQNILRFRESLEHIAEGKLYPELDFTDQSHFIKEIKKFSGVIPKELLKNKNDRFIQFSALNPK